MTWSQYCDQPDCAMAGYWFVGLRFRSEVGRGHFACDQHIAAAARVTLAQLASEGWGYQGVVLIPVKVTSGRAS